MLYKKVGLQPIVLATNCSISSQEPSARTVWTFSSQTKKVTCTNMLYLFESTYQIILKLTCEQNGQTVPQLCSSLELQCTVYSAWTFCRLLYSLSNNCENWENAFVRSAKNGWIVVNNCALCNKVSVLHVHTYVYLHVWNAQNSEVYIWSNWK